MTAQKTGEKGRGAFFLVRAAISLSTAILLLTPGIGAKYALYGLEISARSVIPSVFPFAVLGSLMCLQSPPRFISNKLSKLFRISPEGAAALIPGLISGFPAGALSVRELYKSGRIDRAEAERLICFTNNPSAAFVTGFVGKGIFGDLKTGLCLFAALQLSTLIAALATGKGVKAPENGALCAKPEKTPGAKEFALAVKNSALSMLNIAAFITFFSVICGYISKIPAGAEVHCALYGFLEIGNGAASLSALPFGLTGSFIAAGAFIGWSGLSVHLQVATLCFDTGIRFKKYIASKLLCSALCALFCAALAPLM